MIEGAQPLMRLTANERRALAEFRKPHGEFNWDKVHGRTLHALQRKKLIEDNSGNRPGWGLTAAGRAALVVPDIFDDLFDTKEKTLVPKAKTPPRKTVKKSHKAVDEFRPIESADTTLHDPVRERWEEGADKSGVRLYCTSSPLTHGKENGRWSLQIFARVKNKRGGTAKHFASNTAAMSREDLLWLRGMIDDAIGRKS